MRSERPLGVDEEGGALREALEVLQADEVDVEEAGEVLAVRGIDVTMTMMMMRTMMVADRELVEQLQEEEEEVQREQRQLGAGVEDGEQQQPAMALRREEDLLQRMMMVSRTPFSKIDEFLEADCSDDQPGGGPGSTPACKCENDAVLRTATKSAANQGRQFWTCSKPQSDQCGFFVSLTSEITSSVNDRAEMARNGQTRQEVEMQLPVPAVKLMVAHDKLHRPQNDKELLQMMLVMS